MWNAADIDAHAATCRTHGISSKEKIVPSTDRANPPNGATGIFVYNSDLDAASDAAPVPSQEVHRVDSVTTVIQNDTASIVMKAPARAPQEESTIATGTGEIEMEQDSELLQKASRLEEDIFSQLEGSTCNWHDPFANEWGQTLLHIRLRERAELAEQRL